MLENTGVMLEDISAEENNRIDELFADVKEFNSEISRIDFYNAAYRAMVAGVFDTFENDVTICIDTGNIEGLYYVLDN